MPTPQQTPADSAQDFATLQFIFQQLAAGMATATIVQVVKCTNFGGVVPTGTVNVHPLVNQMAGDNTAVPHGVLVNLPYVRLHGGDNAVIIDPQPGDIGIAIFASRDISSVKAAKAEANPGSSRQFSMADGMYVGGLLRGAPTQYVRFHSGGVNVVSPTAVTLQAPDITLDGNVHITGDTDSDGGAAFADDVTGQGTSLHTHHHGGVQTGGGNTGPPA